MKKYISIILLALFAVVNSAAQNVVSISSGQGVPGDVVTIDVVLQNSDDVTAAEVVIPLVNKQLTYVDGSCVIDSERANGHQLNAAVVDGALRIYIYNISLAPLKGNEGLVASFNLKLGKSPAEYPLQPQVLLSDAAGKALPVNTSAGAVTILAPQIEVVTQTVDFGHIPIMAQYTKTLTLRNSGTLPLEVTGIEFGASEFSATETSFTIAVGATKSISVAYSPTKRGAIEESVTIISDAVNGKATAALVADPYSVNELHSNRVEGIAGEEVTVELCMNNMEPIVGLQTTFDLPEQLVYVEESFAATERAATHTAVATAKDGKLTLFLYSSKNTPITGNDGVVATFRLRLAGHSGYYSISPLNTVLSNAGQENMTSAVSGEYIVIKSPEISGANELDFGKQPLTEKSTAQYTVRNNGNTPLVINKVAFLNERYKVADELPITVGNYSSAVLNVEYNPIKEGVHSTVMNIYSNDPVNKLKTVQVNGEIYEPNNLTFDGENLQNGNYVVSIGLDNYTNIVAIQMDIHFMPGMTTSNDRLKVSERLAGHSCSITKIDDDTYRFIAFSFNNNSIAGNEGKLFDLTFVPNNGVEYKNAPIVIDNLVLSSSEANNYTSQLTLNAKAVYTHYFVKFVCESEIVSETFQRAGTQIVQPQMPKRTGYTFGGWENVPELSPAEDVVYTGEYKVNKYKLNYLVNGVVFATDSIAYGSAITLIDAPVKEGHTFSGWSEAPETMPASDITIEGSFAVNSYNVIYKVDGEEYQVVPVTYGSELILIDAPVKEGHTFSGWSEAPATMPANDVTIEGSFAVNYYTVTYLVDGEVYKVESIAYGKEIVAPEHPVKEGYTFGGWRDVPKTMPAEDIEITSSFVVYGYKVIYKVDGEEYQSELVEYGSMINLPKYPIKEGHTFSGWQNVPESMPAEDITIEGTFTVNSYNVIYKVDGEEYQVVPVTYGSEITLIEAPTKEGYTFSGWSEAPSTMPAEDITIEGTFTVNSYNVIYKVDGEEYQVVPVVYGSDIVLIDELVKEGHTFSGWSEAPATMPANDITIEGTFTVNNYTLTYLVDGEVYATETVAYGGEIVLRDEPTKEGHTFSGWSEAPATMPASDITIEGSFTVNSYNVIYKVDGEEYQVVPVTYGSELILIEAPTKEGHTFSGWSEAPATMPAEDVVIEGTFAVNYYTIIYIVDGEVYATETVTYGSEIVLRDEPTKEGYTFSGWSEAPATIPAEDVTIEGSFTVNTYSIIYKVDGEEYKVVPVVYGSEIVLIDAPVKEGHTFSGWSEAPATMPAEDVVIEGTFAVNYYTIIYLVDGEVCVTETVAYGSEIVLRDEPTKEGYTFSGWSDAPATMPANDVTIEGSFTVNTYSIIYKVDGEEYKVVPIVYGSEIVVIEAPVKEGHTFSGWSEAPATMPAEDVVIEGTFAVNYYTVTYIVDGEVYAADSIAYGSEIVLLDEPTKEGHAFSGWSEAPATMPAEDVVIEGSFSPITTINGVVYDAEDLIIYNLRGERIIDVDELEQGFYIINGKKVWVK